MIDTVCSCLRNRFHQTAPPHLSTGPWLQQLHLGPGVLAPVGLCCPNHHRLATPSASLATSVPFPGDAGYRAGLWQSPAEQSDLPGFHCCTLQDCRLQLPPGDSICAYPSSSIPTLAIMRKWEPLGLSNNPANQLHAGYRISATYSFALATALLVARSLN